MACGGDESRGRNGVGLRGLPKMMNKNWVPKITLLFEKTIESAFDTKYDVG